MNGGAAPPDGGARFLIELRSGSGKVLNRTILFVKSIKALTMLQPDIIITLIQIHSNFLSRNDNLSAHEGATIDWLNIALPNVSGPVHRTTY